MSGFYYYVPGATGIADAVRAIPHAIDPARAVVRGALRGPDGAGGGSFFADISSTTSGGELSVDGVQWTQAPGRPWWIGHGAELPGPEELSRGRELVGATVRLGDGKPWRVPCAILPAPDGARGESPLPKVRRLRKDGTVERVVAPAYQELYLAADEVWDLFQNKTPIEEQREMQIADIALRTLYRVGVVEISLLGLLTDEALAAIFVTLVNLAAWPSIAEIAAGARGGA